MDKINSKLKKSGIYGKVLAHTPFVKICKRGPRRVHVQHWLIWTGTLMRAKVSMQLYLEVFAVVSVADPLPVY